MNKMSVSILFGAIALFGFLDSTQSVCVLKDAPNQCGSFCIAALRPIMDHNVKTRDQWNYQGVALNETLERLNRIEAQQFEIKSHFESKFLGSLIRFKFAMIILFFGVLLSVYFRFFF